MRSKGIQPLLKSYLNIINILIAEGPHFNPKYARRLVREMVARDLGATDEQIREYTAKVDVKVKEARVADRKSKKHNYVSKGQISSTGIAPDV
jgi:hypothetical protein